MRGVGIVQLETDERSWARSVATISSSGEKKVNPWSCGVGGVGVGRRKYWKGNTWSRGVGFVSGRKLEIDERSGAVDVPGRGVGGQKTRDRDTRTPSPISSAFIGVRGKEERER